MPSLVVLAGPNGSGKSSVFDALRIYKEAHAGYSITSPGNSQIYNLIQQLGPVITVGQEFATISVTIKTSEAERQALALPDEHSGLLTSEVRINKPQGISNPEYTQLLHGDIQELKRLFGSLYTSGSEIGVFDHIGPVRTQGGGIVEGINFSRQSTENELQGLVYNSAGKFASLPNDLVRMHTVDLQQRVDNVANPHCYMERIKDIFAYFLPGTEFLGVELDPELDAPARILVRSGGVTHDISQLSSGQREILMTYTHLEKLAPRNSIILFDEPELHLHPALEGRVIAYLKRLLERNRSQIWVVTHSEEIVGTTELDSLFAMTGRGDPAVEPVRDKAARITLLADMGASVGLQLASPRILMVEGESDIELLKLMFDRLPSGIGLVQAGGKGTLMRLSEQALERLGEILHDGQLFFIRDHDLDDDPTLLDALQAQHAGQFFVLNRYHIENYLLDGAAIAAIFGDFPEIGNRDAATVIEQKLRHIADRQQERVIAARVQAKLNKELRKHIRINPQDGIEVSLLKAAAARREQTLNLLQEESLRQLIAAETTSIKQVWDDQWKQLCIGRDVLKDYYGQHVTRRYIGYEVFRNRIAIKLRESNRIPEELESIIKAVAAGLPAPEA